jgi:hypothetical protein
VIYANFWLCTYIYLFCQRARNLGVRKLRRNMQDPLESPGAASICAKLPHLALVLTGKPWKAAPSLQVIDTCNNPRSLACHNK